MYEYKSVSVDRRALVPRKKWYLECHSNSEFPGGTQVNPFPRERTNLMRKQKGFSLIELLIVVAIILIIAAIAIPNLLKARIAANQASAVGSIRTIVTSNTNYQSTFGGYAAALSGLGGVGCTAVPAPPPTMAASCLIDNVLATA